jgi:ACS family glucarate transporter-like MFS transporter
VVAMTVLLGMVTYLDRVCISKLAPNIMADLSLSKVEMGYVFSTFALSYAIFGLPAARWADRLGTRLLLVLIVCWWSFFTMATAVVWGLASLLVVRFLFGAGEAGAWPCVTKTFSRWIPRQERGTAQGIFFAGAHLTGGLTPLLVVWLTGFMSWRAIFVLFGLTGFLWSVAWYLWYRETPAEHPAVNAAELNYITAEHEKNTAADKKGREYWARLLKDRNMLALCVIAFSNTFAFYFCITWLPTYLEEKYHFNAAALGLLAGLPLILSVICDLCGGVTSDWLTARFGLRIGRCGLGGVAYLLAAMAVLAVPSCPQPVLAAILFALGVGAIMFTLGAAWGTCIEIAGESAATVSATMNTAGQVGSLLCPLIVAYTLKWFTNDWNISIYLIGILLLVAAACWGFINPHKRIFD